MLTLTLCRPFIYIYIYIEREREREREREIVLCVYIMRLYSIPHRETICVCFTKTNQLMMFMKKIGI